MPLIRVENFGGMVPLQEARLLAPYHPADAVNCSVQSGALTCITALVPIHTLVDPTAKCVFRIPKAAPGIDNMEDSYWLEFPIADTWVVRNPQSGLVGGGRFYWADGTNPPGYTTESRVIAGDPNLILGIPSPETAPTVTPGAGSGPDVTRAYVYTWVSQYGEEGPPSPPTVATGPNDATWAITLTAPTVDDTTGRALEKVRIYRTITSDQGVATFFFVTEQDISDTTFDDDIPDGTVALNDQLQSTNWLPPPENLKGLVNMPNGMIAGFAGNEIWFCEPYRPWAWPPQYVLGVESPIVGLGTQQQSLITCTTGWTYIATGIRPDAMALTKVANLEPCTAMGSIVSSPDGVLYTSVNGLIVCNAGVEVNGTANLVRKDQWPKFLYLPNLHATYINRSYLAFSSPNEGVFQEDAFQVELFADDPLGAFETIDYSGTRDGALISLKDERLAYMRLQSDTPVDNVLSDVWTGETMILRDGVVEHVDLRENYPRLGYRWRSKVFQTPYKENWAAAKVFFDLPPGPEPDRPTYFRFFADGRQVMERKLTKSGEQFRLPSGYKSDTVQFELDGQLIVFNVQIATSARELRNA